MFHGRYINLDRRTDRRAHMERELAAFGLTQRYRRVSAEADPVPAYGCYRSHLKVLDEAMRLDGIVHVLEDDSILSTQLAPFLESDAMRALLARYDILFLDMWVDPAPPILNRYRAAWANREPVVDLRNMRIGATSSYVIAPRSYAKVRDLWQFRFKEGAPIDNVCSRLVRDGAITAAVTIPFLTGVDATVGAASDIQSIPDEAQRLLIVLRTRFFVGAGPRSQPSPAPETA